MRGRRKSRDPHPGQKWDKNTNIYNSLSVFTVFYGVFFSFFLSGTKINLTGTKIQTAFFVLRTKINCPPFCPESSI